jgi:agmatine/peptidylarginine deiminase
LEDDEAIETVRKYADPKRDVIPVPMGRIPEMGGGIRCLTWQNRRPGMTGVPL